ncbi:MAG TPA: organic solvent tolerance ABC transporter substrate-binding protein [Nitrospiraceae bacterium]|nr:organic solvent tolerance ABC transporter substrate-binding protein [Nitrospiraceae bacterium]HCZ11094.1 organic solvent tolerance ABC transporter substrate-binding protein [Nitrospiraceae bacterium]
MLLIFAFMAGNSYAAYAGEPTDQVKQTIDKVLDILRDKELKKPSKTKERRTIIRKFIDERFDFEEMAKRALGLHWRKRTAEEKKEFVPLFMDLLERSYIKKIENYTDEKILYIAERIEGGYSDVGTKVVTKRNVEIPIDYRLLKRDGKWEVYDVTIEGVSLINNYRTQFNKIIRADSYEELVKRMKNKQEEELFEDKAKK